MKLLNISIPDDKILDINGFSPEENYLMLKIGSDCLREGRNAVAGLTQKEIYAKIKEEASGDVHRLEMDIIVQKELAKKMEEKISKMYECQVAKLENQIEILSNQLKEQQFGSQEMIEKVVRKEREKFDLLLQEKDRQNQLNREAFDKAEKIINKTDNKTSIAIGDDGEQIFENLADTFKDFAGYKIENKAKQGHKGDFHLFFEDFNILVDSKNYSGSVQKKEIKKIEADLMVNDNMHYAWLVSLNSNICEYNRFTICHKWINTDSGVKCILFINNLLDNKDPANILRLAWLMCSEFNRLTKKVTKEDGSLVKYREKELLYKKHINNLQDRVSEMRRHINGTLNVLKLMDNDLLEMLSLASDEIMNEKIGLNGKINEWWDMNIEYTADESKITSTEIWSRFKKDNKEYVLDNKITIDQFKDVITNIADSSTYTEKSKKSAIEFNGFKFKEIVIENLVIEKIELPKKVNRNKKSDFYFSEEQDDKILQEYENEINDIMTISLANNVRPWQVVSLLVHYKKITRRSESRGYDKYKETDEYKNNCNN
jgi:hypothetical protein